MKYLLIFILLCFAGCKQPSNESTLKLAAKTIDTSRYAILKLNSFKGIDSITYPFNKKYKSVDLSFADIVKIERLITKRANEYNNKEKEFWNKINEKSKRKKQYDKVVFTDTIAHPEKYFKQLIAVINEKGEKEVYVNCFCTGGEKSYWKKSMVEVDDGGACFFQANINLTKGTITKFYVNGVA